VFFSAAMVIALACSTPEADKDAAKDNSETDVQDGVQTMTCEWIVALSFPPQITGTCSVKKVVAPDLKVNFTTYKPIENEVKIKIGEEEIAESEYTYSEEENNVIIQSQNYLDQAITLKIYYVGEKVADDVVGKTLGIVVDKTGLDGCSFVIELEDGDYVEPLDLPGAFKQDSLEIYFDYKPVPDSASICMLGDVVYVTNVAKKITADPGSDECASKRLAFVEVTELLDEESKSYATDDDCLAYGVDPSYGCGQPNFTSKDSYDLQKSSYISAGKDTLDYCGLSTDDCNDSNLKLTPVCVADLCEGE